MTTALERFHLAHKERLARFAQAALHHQRPAAQMRPAAPLIEPKADYARRRYETASRQSANMPTAQRILRAIAAEFDMTVTEMLCDNRDLKYTTPRYFAIGLMLELTDMSLPAIGRRLGGRDHTTIINGRKRFLKLVSEEAVRNRFDQIKAEVARG